MIIATDVPGHCEEHGMQCELPRERLSPGLHTPPVSYTHLTLPTIYSV